mmetsp:Transcript_101784/g.328469  ORF Transcript_101784/g.328469 Transcript_101784/m.328469 type:complete len:275 (-) Transcript_101784:205-1029(-)
MLSTGRRGVGSSRNVSRKPRHPRQQRCIAFAKRSGRRPRWRPHCSPSWLVHVDCSRSAGAVPAAKQCQSVLLELRPKIQQEEPSKGRSTMAQESPMQLRKPLWTLTCHPPARIHRPCQCRMLMPPRHQRAIMLLVHLQCNIPRFLPRASGPAQPHAAARKLTSASAERSRAKRRRPPARDPPSPGPQRPLRPRWQCPTGTVARPLRGAPQLLLHRGKPACMPATCPRWRAAAVGGRLKRRPLQHDASSSEGVQRASAQHRGQGERARDPTWAWS